MTKRNNEESRIQQACVRWFAYQYPKYHKLLFAVPNGGSRRVVEASIMKAEGVTSGVADLFLSVPNEEYPGFYIEMKTEKGKQSYEQKVFQSQVEKVGYKYLLCRSVETFIREVTEYLNRV